MANIVQGLLELMHGIQFFTLFVMSSEKGIITKIFTRVYDSLGKPFFKICGVENHPYLPMLHLILWSLGAKIVQS